MRHRSPIALLTCIAVGGLSSCSYRRFGDGKKGAGEICSSAFECESGLCGGRCCGADAGGCLCPQPSAGNLIQNPGFDVGPGTGWTMHPGGGVVSMAADDATQCPWSGSVFLSDVALDSNATISQCVSVSPSTDYNFGARFKTSMGGWLYCDLDQYSMPDCQGPNMNVASLTWLNVRWSGNNGDVDVVAAITTMPTTVSASVLCHPDPGVAGYFDMIYLTPVPGGY